MNRRGAAIPVLHDETHRGKWYLEPQVHSMGNDPNLLGYLEHHAPGTDGSFAICMAAGNATLLSKKLYESIPKQHRPPLDTEGAMNNVTFSLQNSAQKPLGSTIMPVVLTDKITGKKFCIKLYALVLEHLSVGMFIGTGGINFLEATQWGGGSVTYDMKFWDGKKARVEYKY